MGTLQARKVSRPVRPDIETGDDDFDSDVDDGIYITRMPSSARRYRTAPPVRQDVLEEPVTGKGVLIQRRRASLGQHNHSMHGVASNAVSPTRLETQLKHTRTGPLSESQRFPWVPVLIGMVVMVLLVMALNAFSSWWQVYQDDLHFGRPRTFQFDAVVHHEDSPSNPTHFICLNLHGHVEIIEIPGGNTAHTRIYSGPTLLGNGQDLTPVTGEVREIDGKLDLIIHIGSQQIIFVNDGQTFHEQ